VGRQPATLRQPFHRPRLTVECGPDPLHRGHRCF
jgi:hypothetical protein